MNASDAYLQENDLSITLARWEFRYRHRDRQISIPVELPAAGPVAWEVNLNQVQCWNDGSIKGVSPLIA